MCFCKHKPYGGGKYHEEDLLQPLNAVLIPAGVDVHAACLTADQVLSQHHDEPLREKRGGNQQHISICTGCMLV